MTSSRRRVARETCLFGLLGAQRFMAICFSSRGPKTTSVGKLLHSLLTPSKVFSSCPRISKVSKAFQCFPQSSKVLPRPSHAFKGLLRPSKQGLPRFVIAFSMSSKVFSKVCSTIPRHHPPTPLQVFSGLSRPSKAVQGLSQPFKAFHSRARLSGTVQGLPRWSKVFRDLVRGLLQVLGGPL